MELRDEDLMRDVQAGRAASFDELVRRYRMPLTRLAASKLGNAAAAEDVVQETFLSVYAARHTYRPEFAFRTWLWTIGLNLCKKHARTSSRQSLALSRPLDPHVSGGLQKLVQTERHELLRQALDQLPEPQADALRLRFFGGLKFEEIAAAMNGSISGAKLRVKQGLLKLAAILPPGEELES